MVAAHHQQAALKLLVDLLLKWERGGERKGQKRKGVREKVERRREGGRERGRLGRSRKSGFGWEIGKSEEEGLGKGMFREQYVGWITLRLRGMTHSP